MKIKKKNKKNLTSTQNKLHQIITLRKKKSTINLDAQLTFIYKLLLLEVFNVYKITNEVFVVTAVHNDTDASIEEREKDSN